MFKKFLLIIVASFLTISFVSCEDNVSTDSSLSSYIGMEADKYVPVSADETVNVEAKIYASNTSSSDRTFNLIVNPTSTHDATYYSVPASVTIPAGEKVGVFEVSITGTNIGTGKTLIVGLEQQEGVNFASWVVESAGVVTDSKSNEIIFNIKEVCTENPVIIEIVTDQWGSETEWELYSDLDFTTPIASGGPYADQAAAGAYPQAAVEVCLADGAYTFVIYDSPYADGMDSGYGNGFYRLTKVDSSTGDETVIAQNGVFTNFDVVSFNLP